MNSGSKNKFFKRNKNILTIAIVVIIFLLLDVVSAKTFRYLKGEPFFKFLYDEKRKRWIEDLTTNEKSYRVPSKKYHHDLKSKASVYLKTTMWEKRKYHIFTDSLGFKSKSVKETPLVSNNYRILFIGDSFTEGVGMSFEESFVGIIADKLLGENIEVLNAGAATYSPIIYWRKIKYLLEELGLKFDELIVFIDISDIYDEAYCYTLGNDEAVIYLNEKTCLGQIPENEKLQNIQKQNNQQEVNQKYAIEMIKDLLRDNTIVSFFILNKLYDLLLQKEEHPVYDYENEPKYMIKGKRGMWTMNDKLYEEFGGRGLEKAKLYMGKLVELATEHNIKLTIAVYPWPEQIFHNDLNSKQVSFWKKFAKENNISFLNFFPCFINLNKDKPLKTLDEYFLERDMHWNEKGNRLIADAFLKYYRKRGLNSDYCN